jgi:hypothetical protein
MKHLDTLDLDARVTAVMKLARAHHSEILADLIGNLGRRIRGSIEAGSLH